MEKDDAVGDWPMEIWALMIRGTAVHIQASPSTTIGAAIQRINMVDLCSAHDHFVEGDCRHATGLWLRQISVKCCQRHLATSH